MLTVVVLNMDGLENLKTLIPSLEDQTFQDFNLVVSDNGSTDGSVEWLKERGIEVMENGENLGFSGGNNVALREVETEYSLVLNDDTRLEPDTLETLVGFMEENPGAGAVQPTIMSWDGEKVQSTGLIRTHGAFITERDKGLEDVRADEPEEVPATHGCCSLYRTEVLREVGFFDEGFNPIYQEDADLSFRIRDKGYGTYWHPETHIYHKGAFTTSEMGYEARLSFHRNRYRLIQKHWSGTDWLSFLAWLPAVSIFYSLVKPDPAHFRATGEFIRKSLRGETVKGPVR